MGQGDPADQADSADKGNSQPETGAQRAGGELRGAPAGWDPSGGCSAGLATQLTWEGGALVPGPSAWLAPVRLIYGRFPPAARRPSAAAARSVIDELSEPR